MVMVDVNKIQRNNVRKKDVYRINNLMEKIGLKEKPYFTTGFGALYNEDCLEILTKINSNTFNCIFADPPFNLSKNYGTKFVDNNDDYFDWSAKWIHECIRVLKDGGSFFIYAMPSMAVKLVNELNKNLEFRNWIAMSMKSGFPISNRLYPAHYTLLYYTKGKPSAFNQLRTPITKCRHCGKEIKDYGGHRSKLHPEGLNLSDFWEDTSPNRHHKYKVRPGVNELKITIPERAILMSTNEDDLVLDPFGGGGSTYEVCEKFGRKWVGIEKYDCEVIRKRLENKIIINQKIPNIKDVSK